MRVLLTNDDGYRAEGIWALAREFAARGAEVTIVAPESQCSAASHAVTLHKPLRLRRAAKLDEENINVYYTNGTPSDSAMLGLLEVRPDSELLVSGINGGPNLGEDVLYSGTVAAAMEGALLGYRAISVSLSDYEKENYALAAVFTAGIAAQLAEARFPKKTVLNVNVPPVPVEQYKGFEVAPLGSREYRDVLQKRVDPRGGVYYWVTGQIVRDESAGDTDNSVVSRGFVSVTPLILDFTDHSMIPKCVFKDPVTGK
jgi:5'-nucleotidase